MNWMSFFQKIENISAEQAREFMAAAPTDSYQLLDVRQPREYSQDHIPGAILIPLKELPDRIHELSAERKTIVYCRSGIRSRTGCQILKDNGFDNAINMTGGILSWRGHKASGDESLGLEYFLDADFESAISMAYSMEAGLQQFYLLLADRMSDPDCRELLNYMARLEDGHMAKLASQRPELRTKNGAPHAGPVVEGGFDGQDFLSRYGDQVDTMEEILHVAMMFESQAYDLYSRLSRKQDDPELQTFFAYMAGEEKSHLERLTIELEKRIV